MQTTARSSASAPSSPLPRSAPPPPRVAFPALRRRDLLLLPAALSLPLAPPAAAPAPAAARGLFRMPP